jgi:hypothetical protein
MFCMHCGMASPEAARFCPACGTAIARLERVGAAKRGPAPVKPAVGRVPNDLPLSSSNYSFVRKTIIAGVVLVCTVGALAIYMEKGHVFESAYHAFASSNRTHEDWDGLDPKEVLAAKNAMDADIELEERAASSALRATPQQARSSQTAETSAPPQAKVEDAKYPKNAVQKAQCIAARNLCNDGDRNCASYRQEFNEKRLLCPGVNAPLQSKN